MEKPTISVETLKCMWKTLSQASLGGTRVEPGSKVEHYVSVVTPWLQSKV